MIKDHLRKKKERPGGGGGGSLATVDVSSMIPPTDDILTEVNKAITRAKRLEGDLLAKEKQRASRRCGC